MGDAVARNLVELPMQRDRIRRGQRAIDGALRRNQPDGADAGGDMTEPLPDLAGEGGNRGLAAGAGHCGDHWRLPRIKFCRGQRQRAARIRRHDEGHATIARGGMVARDRNGSGGNRCIDESGAIGLAAGQREEQIARLYRPAVHREALDLGRPCDLGRIGGHDRIRLRLDRGVIAEEVAKSHDLPVRPAQSGASQLRLTGLALMPQE